MFSGIGVSVNNDIAKVIIIINTVSRNKHSYLRLVIEYKNEKDNCLVIMKSIP